MKDLIERLQRPEVIFKRIIDFGGNQPPAAEFQWVTGEHFPTGRDHTFNLNIKSVTDRIKFVGQRGVDTSEEKRALAALRAREAGNE